MRKSLRSLFKKKPASHQLNTDPIQDQNAQQLNTEHPQNPEPYDDIKQDPDFGLMLAESQQGHWDECKQLIKILDEKYPGNSKIEEFKSDFELQFNIINEIESSAKEDKKSTIIHYLKIAGIIAGSLIAIFLIVYFLSQKMVSVYQEKQLQAKADQIDLLSGQVEFLLYSGQPEKAQDLIERMKALDPASPKISELTQRTDEVIKINTLYLDAIDKLDNGLNSDALSILMKIESEYPGYKDVPQLIDETNSKINVSQALSTGSDAFIAEDWQATIDNLEQVLTLDPAYSDPDLKGMLVYGYLHRTIQLLEKNNPTFMEIDQAEFDFSRAIILIPQIKDNSSELENLRQVSRNLLELKYTQAADQLVKDPAQTIDSVNLAFNYLKKALSLDPQNSSLQAEVYKLNLYNSGFHYFIDMNWQPAIQQLTALVAMDENYPNGYGYARQLLYDAHTSQGTQNFSVGSYLDARKDYELAETLASGSGNLLSYYLAEINLGRSMGKLNLYKEANSYFTNAIQTIDYQKRAMASPAMLANLNQAIILDQAGQYENSYNLFVETLVGNNAFYETKKINAFQGNCLALIAAQNQSSVQAILEENNLPRQAIVSSDQLLVIPAIP